MPCKHECTLAESCKTIKVLPRGKKKLAKIMIVGEAPDRVDDREGKLFEGDDGLLLWAALDDADIKLKDVFATSVVRCSPLSRKVTAKEIKACSPILDREIAAMAPKVIVALGNTAFKRLAGETGVLKKIGRVIETQYGKVIPVPAPSYFRRFGVDPSKLSYEPNVVKFLEALRLANSIAHDKKIKKKHTGKKATYHVVTKNSDVARAVKYLDNIIKTKPLVSVDIETGGEGGGFLLAEKDGKTTKIISIAITAEERFGLAFPVYHPANKLSLSAKNKLASRMKTILEDPKIEKLGQLFKFDVNHLTLNQIKVRGWKWDSLYLHYCLNEQHGTHAIRDLAQEFTDMGDYEKKLDTYKKEHKIKEYSQFPLKMLLEYNAMDVDAALRLKNVFTPLVIEQELMPVHDFMVECATAFSDLELGGIKYDEEHAGKVEKKYRGLISDIEDKIRSFPTVQEFEQDREEKINIGSPNQIRDLLFTDYGLTPIKTTAADNPSTDEATMNILSASYDPDSEIGYLLQGIIDFRHYRKMNSTYVKGFLNSLYDDGRVRATINAHGTRTGRVSVTNPPIQTIPRDSYMRQLITRDDEDSLFLMADYDQAELRYFGIASGDVKLADAFNSGGDIHERVAMDIYSLDGDVSKEQRVVAKSVNFGICFCISATGLAKNINEGGGNITEQEAGRFLKEWFANYPRVKTYQDKIRRYVKKHGYVRCATGRIRRFPEVSYGDNFLVAEAEREAINQMIQPVISDFCLKAMVNIHKKLKKMKLKSRVLMPVHDAILLNVKKDEVDIVPRLVQSAMMQSPYEWEFMNKTKVHIPLTVSVEMGTSWGDVEKIDDPEMKSYMGLE